jgi:hypothetical protein
MFEENLCQHLLFSALQSGRKCSLHLGAGCHGSRENTAQIAHCSQRCYRRQGWLEYRLAMLEQSMVLDLQTSRPLFLIVSHQTDNLVSM